MLSAYSPHKQDFERQIFLKILMSFRKSTSEGSIRTQQRSKV